MSERERLSVQVDAELARDLKSLSAETGTRLSDTIRELLRIGLANFTRPKREPSRIVEDPFGLGE